MSDLDRCGFEFGPESLMCCNIDLPDGGVTSDLESLDRAQATILAVAQMVEGAIVEHAYATPEGAVCQDPLALNFELVLSNGKRVCVMGDWRIKVYEAREAEINA